jgi:predicted RNA binding protein YcfA (HicA-like mRNA interferase family)
MPRKLRVSSKKFEKFIIANGCVYVRTKGDHHIYHRKDLFRPIVIPIRDTLPLMVVENNLATLGISYDDFERAIARR